MPPTPPPSPLVIDELFSSQDDAFVPMLRKVADRRYLSTFATRWARDPRPWSREQIFAYLDAPLGFRSDAPLIKRLYKHAEAERDDVLVAAFLTAFDCAVRRSKRTLNRFVRRPGGGWDTYDEEYLTLGNREPGLDFSYHTLYYLRRRAWRYFRRMGHQRPDDYVKAIAAALVRYDDEHLSNGINLLDSWGLVHALFGTHPALNLTNASHVNLKPDRDLAELTPAPYFLPLWQRDTAVPVLLALVGTARARVVRIWSMDLLRRQHGRRLPGVTLDSLLPLFDHDDEEVQQFAAELLDALPNLDQVPIDQWLRLLRTRSLTALSTITAAALRNGVGDRLSLAQLIDLATERALPLARFAWQILQPRTIQPSDHLEITRLADARAPAVAAELTTWSLNHLATQYDADLVVRFFDALLKETRDAAWHWLTPQSPAWNDPALWSRLLETPYDDVRAKLVATLAHRAKLPGRTPRDLAPVWTSVLLNVHRGGRSKLTALRQVSDALRSDPDAAESLLPTLAVAMRSVRAPESRAGVAALVSALDARPDLAPLVARHLPTLQLIGEGCAP